MTRMHFSQEQSCRYSCSPQWSLRQLCVLHAQYLRALCFIGRSKIIVSKFVQNRFVHMWKELKISFSAKAHALCWASITAAVLLVAGTGHNVDSQVPEQAELIYPKAQCTGNRILRNSRHDLVLKAASYVHRKEEQRANIIMYCFLHDLTLFSWLLLSLAIWYQFKVWQIIYKK